MKRLDVDIGNTQTKWRFGHDQGTSTGVVAPPIQDSPDRICVASVAAQRHEIEIRFASVFDVRPEFAETTFELAGVTCGYKNPASLGVDRWLAVVAAWNAARQPVVVVDLGTAATLDFVTRDGTHVGGYIVPGLKTMATSLARNTTRVKVADDLAAELLPGRETAQAVRRGTTAMLVSLVEWSVARFTCSCGEAPAVFLTGGDAERLSGHLSSPVRVEPDLVLDGLTLALP
ncbi:MAG: type III pantothenate kinase [Gammaproteobacteria bacterium]|nr:type III pantothenate kinase [Gammaproteobacteria bacterium]